MVPAADIFIQFPGASAEEVENLVTINLEKKLWEIDGVEYVYSASRPGGAVVTVRFYVGQDRENSLIKLYNKVWSNIDQVPPGVTSWIIKAGGDRRRPHRDLHPVQRPGFGHGVAPGGG